ncbi:unnamed protein product, partial [Symbiodinium necroappetens]
MASESDSSGAFNSADIEREHLATLDAPNRRLYLEEQENRVRRARLGEVFGPPPPEPTRSAPTTPRAAPVGETALTGSPITARRRSRTPPRISRRSRHGGAEASSHGPTSATSAAGLEGTPPAPSCTYYVEEMLSEDISRTDIPAWEQGMPTDMELENAALLAETFHGWKDAARPEAAAEVVTREEPARSRSPRRAAPTDVFAGTVPGSLAASATATDGHSSRIGTTAGTYILEPAQEANGIVNIVLTLRLAPPQLYSSVTVHSPDLRLGLSVRPSGSCVSSSLFPFWSGSATGAWPAVPAAPCCMGRAQRQRRQSARPGQQNRQLTSDSTEDLVTAPTASSAAEDESPDFSSHQLTSRERALFNFVTWSTKEPPPMTIFVRPYLQSLVRSASATKEATGDDESVDTVRPPMTPPTRPDVPGGHSDRRISEDGRLLPEPKHSSGPSTAEAVRSRKRRKLSRSISSISSDFDLGSLSRPTLPCPVDPRGRSPLPRRRRCTRPREAEDATGISLKGEPFLLPRPKKYPLQPPVTVDSTPTSVIDPAPPREQQQKSANPATVSANPSAKTPHRKFRTPKTAQKFPKKKHGSGGTSARGGKEQGKVVKASAD